LKSELGGRLEQIAVALMTPRYDLLAETAYKAMSGIGTKEKRLVDVLCTATNNDIRMINASYQRCESSFLFQSRLNSSVYRKVAYNFNCNCSVWADFGEGLAG
jgi:hypothetical protein